MYQLNQNEAWQRYCREKFQPKFEDAPEAKLLLAKIMLAIRDYVLAVKTFGPAFDIELHKQPPGYQGAIMQDGLWARKYIFRDNPNDSFGFGNLCNLCNINRAAILRFLQSLTKDRAEEIWHNYFYGDINQTEEK
jgi:hypothetical protein